MIKLTHAVLVLCLSLPGFAHEGYRQKNETRDGRVRVLNNNLTTVVGRRGAESYTPAEVQNEIDTLTFAKMKADGVPINALCDDAGFLRRTALILTGRLPDPADVRAFHGSSDAGRRGAYIDQLLDSDAFRTRWTFWFEEYFASTPFLLRGGHSFFNGYLEQAVAENKHLDDMARELLTTMGLTDSLGEPNYFLAAGGNSRLSQDFWDNAAIFTSSKMLGVPLECISCHDGAYHLEDINLYLADKTRNDLWGMAAWFASVGRRPGTINDGGVLVSVNIFEQPSNGYLAETDSGDRPIRSGGTVTPKYLFDGSTPRDGASWLDNIADLITSDRQFARNWANRLWGHAFGLGMVEPMDSFDLLRISGGELPEGWDSQVLDVALLEHMTDSLIAVDFDLKAYFRYMLNSATYQMSSQWYAGNWQEAYAPYYSRYLARRMTAEEVYDSVVVATGFSVDIPQGYFGGYPAPTATYAHQLVDNGQPRGRGLQAVRTFLDAFGRGNRNDQQRTNQGGIAQALMLMNSDVTNNVDMVTQGRIRTYLDQGKSEEQIIEELYLDAFARFPDPAEVDAMKTQLAGFESDQEKALSALWLMINQVAFPFIY